MTTGPSSPVAAAQPVSPGPAAEVVATPLESEAGPTSQIQNAKLKFNALGGLGVQKAQMPILKTPIQANSAIAFNKLNVKPIPSLIPALNTPIVTSTPMSNMIGTPGLGALNRPIGPNGGPLLNAAVRAPCLSGPDGAPLPVQTRPLGNPSLKIAAPTLKTRVPTGESLLSNSPQGTLFSGNFPQLVKTGSEKAEGAPLPAHEAEADIDAENHAVETAVNPEAHSGGVEIIPESAEPLQVVGVDVESAETNEQEEVKVDSAEDAVTSSDSKEQQTNGGKKNKKGKGKNKNKNNNGGGEAEVQVQ